MESNYWSWLLLGIFVGSFFDKLTIVGMVIIWMVINNYQLPEILGGQPIQEAGKHLTIQLMNHFRKVESPIIQN